MPSQYMLGIVIKLTDASHVVGAACDEAKLLFAMTNNLLSAPFVF